MSVGELPVRFVKREIMASSRKPFKTTLHNFRYAFRGIGILFRDERNAWIHLTAAVIVTLLGFLLGLSRLEWMIVVGVIAAVIAAEAFNSALERLCDRVSLQHHPLIGQAKDLAAGAVLITAIGAAIVGLLVFVPKIYACFL